VTTTVGVIDLGNGGADTTVQVTVPTIAAGGSVTVTFDALIASPLPPGVTQVENQATISSDEQEDFIQLSKLQPEERLDFAFAKMVETHHEQKGRMAC